MRCGDEIWQTRSTWPMSMPSSSDAVATSTLSLPSRRRCSASRRTSFAEAAVVGSDALVAEPLGQLVRHALGQAPRVHRDQRGAMRLDQLHEAVVDLLPHLVRHHRFERRARHLDGEVHPALVARSTMAQGSLRQESRDLLDRLLRRRQSDALQLASAHVIEPLERQAPGARRGAIAAPRGSRRRSRRAPSSACRASVRRSAAGTATRAS